MDKHEASDAHAFRIVNATKPDEVEVARLLIREYAAWLAIDLSFQNFDVELASLPGDYAPPDGRLLLALNGAQSAGCVALRKLGPGICEMKRMWVRPAFRGFGLGRILAEKIIAEAREAGYKQMLLDSLPSLKHALSLYRSLGFREIAPYRYNPEPDPVFLQLDLTGGETLS